MTTRFFDGHNDCVLKLWRAGDRAAKGLLEGGGANVTLPKARAGGLTGGFFAVYVPQPPTPGDHADRDGRIVDYPPLDAIDPVEARRQGLEIADILLGLSRRRPDAFRVCRSGTEIARAEAEGAFAAVLHIEGAEPIGADLSGLETFHAAGLRSIGPVWSRPNLFAHGVPFRFPGGPDEGPGLTEAGQALIRACDEMGILIDLSHMNEAGFWDIARISDRPLMATHSNCHALSPSSRNLTDRQIDAIAERDGIVGVNFACGFLREDGVGTSNTGLEVMLRHFDHLIARLGEDRVALGSDFDGAVMPAEIGDAAGLPALAGAMRAAGWGEALIDKVCHDNWTAFLARELG